MTRRYLRNAEFLLPLTIAREGEHCSARRDQARNARAHDGARNLLRHQEERVRTVVRAADPCVENQLVARLDVGAEIDVKTGQGAIVMTNSDNGPPLFNEILRAISHEYNWTDYRPKEPNLAQIDPATLASYVGQYDANGTPVTVSLQSGKLSIQTPPMGPSPFQLYPSAEDRFFLVEADDFEVRFVKDSQAKVSELQIQAGTDRATAARVK